MNVEHSTVALSEAALHIAEAGPKRAASIVFLHGWPQDWSAWLPVITLAAQAYRCVAIDLPGIGGSRVANPRGDKYWLAQTVHELLRRRDLTDVTLVGHDIGGMVTFAYLRQFSDLGHAVIMDTALPSLAPWERVLANPYIWHFAFHNVPQLPTQLATGNVKIYFDYFYEATAARKDSITQEVRDRYVASYSVPEALTQGFEFYRAFRQDAVDNTRDQKSILTPTLYLRGSTESGDINTLDCYSQSLLESFALSLTWPEPVKTRGTGVRG